MIPIRMVAHVHVVAMLIAGLPFLFRYASCSDSKIDLIHEKMRSACQLPNDVEFDSRAIKYAHKCLETKEANSRSSFRDVVLILGNIDSGKTTLARILTDDESLVSYKISEDNYGIRGMDEPKYDPTIFPEMLYDNLYNFAYYDCPGFSDGTDELFDIVTKFNLQRIIRHARSIKIILTIKHVNVIKYSENEKTELERMLEKAAKLLKKFPEFKNSVLLVVTQAPLPSMPSRAIDKEETRRIAKVLKKYKSKKIKTLTKSLRHNNNTMKKIFVFRKPNKNGKIPKMRLYKDFKSSLRASIRSSIRMYTTDVEFTLKLSKKTMESIEILFKEIKKPICTFMNNLLSTIRQSYDELMENQNNIQVIVSKLNELSAMLKLKYKKLSRKQKTLETFIQEILNLIFHVDMKQYNVLHSEAVSYTQYITLIDRSDTTLFNAVKREWLGQLQLHQDYIENNIHFFAFITDMLLVKPTYEYITKIKDKAYPTNVITNEHATNQFLQKLSTDGILTPEMYRFLSIYSTTFHIKMLGETIRSMTEKLTCHCDDSNKKLLISGDYVSFKDVHSLLKDKHCRSCEFELLEIFSPNKVFFDKCLDFNELLADESGSVNINVAIMAPEWVYILSESCNINLNGSWTSKNPGVNKPLSPRRKKAKSGDHGWHGGSAGRVLGVAFDFTKFPHPFYFTAVGGDGGNGLNGARGRMQKEIADNAYCSQYTCKNINVFSKYSAVYRQQVVCTFSKKAGTVFRFKPLICRNGEEGGNGGNAGQGGHGGEIRIVALQGYAADHNVPTGVSSGGHHGRPGKGGAGGKRCRIEHDPFYARISCYRRAQEVYYLTRYYSKDGKNGTDGQRANISKIYSFLKPAYVLNDFIYFLRGHVQTPIYFLRILDFFSKLDHNKEIMNMQSVDSLVDKMQGLENQYNDLKGEIDLLPLYQSLFNYALQWSAHVQMSETERKVFNHFKAIVFSKILYLSRDSKILSVTRVKDFIRNILVEIHLYEKNSQKIEVRTSNAVAYGEYDEYLQDKKVIARQFLEDMTNHVENIFYQLDGSITTLVHEIEDEIQDHEKNVEALNKKKQELIRSMKWRRALAIFKCVITIITSVVSIAISTLIRRRSEMDSNNLQTVINQLKDTVKLETEKEKHKTQYLITVSQKYIDRNIRIADVESRLRAATNPAEVMRIREDLTDALVNMSKTGTRKILLSTIPVTAAAVAAIANAFREIKELNFETSERLEEFNKAIAEEYDAIRHLKEQLAFIYQQMGPLINNVVENLQEMLQSKNTSTAQLDFGKWKLGLTLNKLKSALTQVAEGHAVSTTIQKLVTDLDNSFNAITSMFKDIESQNEKNQLAQFIFAVNSDPSDPTFDHLLNMLKENIIFDKFELARRAYSQFSFPQVQHNLRVDSVAVIKETLELWNMGMSESHIVAADQKIFFRDFTGVEDAFYVWEYQDHKEQIDNLLNGKAVFFFTDIFKPVTVANAVKFRKIYLRFRALDPNRQKQLRSELRKYSVELTHMGDSVYRCCSRYYLIETSPVRYSFNAIDSTADNNQAYLKLLQGHYLRSPFATWKVQLADNYRDGPVKLRHRIPVDIYLEGMGTYTKDISDHVCDQIKNSYKQIYNIKSSKTTN